MFPNLPEKTGLKHMLYAVVTCKYKKKDFSRFQLISRLSSAVAIEERNAQKSSIAD